MRQYTTPTYTLTVKGVDLTAADGVWVTFADSNRAIIVTKDSPTVSASGDDTIVETTLSQAETALFAEDTKSGVQVNWLDGTKRFATNIVQININENLLKEILPNV